MNDYRHYKPRRTVRLVWLLCAMGCALALFGWQTSLFNANKRELDGVIESCDDVLARLNAENAKLSKTLEEVNTDVFVERQARKLYRYMMRDEIRLVITNPEVLYGEEGVPSR